MDPDKTLSDIKELVELILAPELPMSRVSAFGLELAEKVDALDQWLFAGGFLPHDWKWRGSGCQD